MQLQLSRVEPACDAREPTARELVQRHRIASASSVPLISPKRPSLSVLKRGGSVIPSLNQQQAASASSSLSRDCVFSLHQNMRSTLLFGKNNVAVLPPNGTHPLKGYLSLHQDQSDMPLFLKWTANMFMHSSSQPSSQNSSPSATLRNERSMWRYTINVRMEHILYLHLHQQGEHQPASIVLVDVDGVQHSSFEFLSVQQCVAFLTALESAFAPFYRLDPPLRYQEGKGKMLPRIYQRSSVNTPTAAAFQRMSRRENGDVNSAPIFEGGATLYDSTPDRSGSIESNIFDEYANDYVFRIVPERQIPIEMTHLSSNSLTDNFIRMATAGRGKLQRSVAASAPPDTPVAMTKKAQDFDTMAADIMEDPTESRDTGSNPTNPISTTNIVVKSLSTACESMRQQIVSRAFYGWLSYCRHLKTIRTHLATVVNDMRIPQHHELDADVPVNDEFWGLCRSEKTIVLYSQLLVRVYMYGIKPHLRSVVWPYLLRLLDWHEEMDSERLAVYSKRYNHDLEEWCRIEVEVVRQDAEAFEEARARQLKMSQPNGKHDENGKSSITSENSCEKSEISFDSEDSSAFSSRSDDEQNIVEAVRKNLHRIEKDVDRCDRNTPFYSERANLDRLKRVMCTYVWRNLSDGYIQGMCDIAAPLLVIFSDEALALGCFEVLMARLSDNFPHKNYGIERNLNNLRSLVQVMNPDLFYQLMNNADQINLYFAYRWFLLDFKRELTYDEVFRVWETIWASDKTVSHNFPLFFAMALLTQYSEVIIENNMDFADVIKFFNEMAEKHNVDELLEIAREKLYSLQEIILELKHSSVS